jgi:YbbR domain-containing protein
MIAFLRHLFLEDFWWKLFSLVLAILVWLIVTFASQKEAPSEPRVFAHLPIRVLSSAEDVRNFKVNPSEAEVTVEANAKTLQHRQSKDVRAMVDLSGVSTAEDLRKPVEVSVPQGVTCLHVTPKEVRIVFPPDR